MNKQKTTENGKKYSAEFQVKYWVNQDVEISCHAINFNIIDWSEAVVGDIKVIESLWAKTTDKVELKLVFTIKFPCLPCKEPVTLTDLES